MPEKKMRFEEDELDLLRSTFGGNDRLLKLLRKVFLPEYDPAAPFGQTIDLWLSLSLENMSPYDRELAIIARNKLIQHVESNILQLQFLANSKGETPEEKEKRLKKDSSK